MRLFKNTLLLAIFTVAGNASFGQCANPTNIYSFVHNGHSYEVVKENKTWTDAVLCAVSSGGYLAEINDVAEQNVIFTELTTNAGINISSTQNQFGTASVWLGGTDQGVEGTWIWDGANTTIGTGGQFWSGAANGTATGGQYTNWGTSPAEPDNSGGQDHLTIIIKPTAVNYGLWNDLVSTNSIYYLIEYNTVTSIEETDLKDNLEIYPNPFNDVITVVNNNAITMERIEIFNLVTQKVKTIYPNEITNNEINVSSLENGMYLLNVHFKNGEFISQKIVK